MLLEALSINLLIVSFPFEVFYSTKEGERSFKAHLFEHLHGLVWMRKLEPGAAFLLYRCYFSRVFCDCLICALFLL